MSQDKIEITCISEISAGPFTTNKRYECDYQGGSYFTFVNDFGFKTSVCLDDNGKGSIYCGDLVVATFKHLVTLKNESIK